jgi:hypothetical protein
MLCLSPAHAQPVGRYGVVIDGSDAEWGYWHRAGLYSVRPGQIDAIDTQGWRWDVGRFYADRESMLADPLFVTHIDEDGKRYSVVEPTSDWAHVIALKFGAAVMEGEEETTLEILFDVYPALESGVPQPLWNLRPDYRFTVTGKGGGIVQEHYQVGHTGT